MYLPLLPQVDFLMETAATESLDSLEITTTVDKTTARFEKTPLVKIRSLVILGARG
jgi:hypothetical protein